MKFLVPNYSCLQNPWLGGYRPQIPFLSVLNWICWTPLQNKIPGYATAYEGKIQVKVFLCYMLWKCVWGWRHGSTFVVDGDGQLHALGKILRCVLDRNWVGCGQESCGFVAVSPPLASWLQSDILTCLPVFFCAIIRVLSGITAALDHSPKLNNSSTWSKSWDE